VFSRRKPHSKVEGGPLFTPSRDIPHDEEMISNIRGLLGAKWNVTGADFGRMDYLGQVRLMMDVDLLVGMHGAGLMNLVFLRPGAWVLEIWGGDRPAVNRHYHNMAALIGVNHHGFSCHPMKLRTIDVMKHLEWIQAAVECRDTPAAALGDCIKLIHDIDGNRGPRSGSSGPGWDDTEIRKQMKRERHERREAERERNAMLKSFSKKKGAASTGGLVDRKREIAKRRAERYPRRSSSDENEEAGIADAEEKLNLAWVDRRKKELEERRLRRERAFGKVNASSVGGENTKRKLRRRGSNEGTVLEQGASS